MNVNQSCINALADLGTRWMLKMQNGQQIEGYILDVNESSFTFGQGGPLASADPETIQYEAVDASLASYYDEQSKRYIDVAWDTNANEWRPVR